MISSARTLLVPVLLFSLAGCGLKGPLYLPDERSQEVPATAPSGSPDSQKVRTPVSPPDPDTPATTPPPPGQ
jgi:predicted small lipoprotein YifL